MKKSTEFLTFFFLAFFVFSISSCGNQTKEVEEVVAEPAFDINTAKSGIMASNKKFMSFFETKDSVGLSELYTEDGKFMMTGAPSFVGRSNIKSIVSGIMNSGISRAELNTTDVWGSENLVTEEGTYKLYAGDNVADEGKYLVLWKKENGKWFFYRDIFNSDLAPQ